MSHRNVAPWGMIVAGFASLLAVSNMGCGGGGNGGGSGGKGGGSTGGSSGGGLQFEPCTAETKVGGFSVLLVDASDTTPEYATFGGRVRDGVNPLDYLKVDTADGACRLMVKPSCSPACTAPQLCSVGDKCVTEPVSHTVGAIDVTGLSTPITGLAAVSAQGNQYNKDLSAGTYPPVAAGGTVTLSAAGGDYAPFTLTARGIAPLVFPGTGLSVNRGQPLMFTWTAQAGTATGKIQATLNVAYHGGGKYRIDCDFDDDGSGEIPAALIDKLLDQGTAGFPTLALTRRSVDSTTLASPGCIEFEVNAYRERQVTVCPMPGKCIVSCGPDKPCPTGQTCGNDKKCS
jgi:hypothetical protein